MALTVILRNSFEWEEKLDGVITNYDSLAELSIPRGERCRDRYGWFKSLARDRKWPSRGSKMPVQF